jgi:hypothetical protein
MAVRNTDTDDGNVIVATLKRGRNYKFFHAGKFHAFKRNVPEEVSEELADELEAVVDRVEDEDGETIEKDYFLIDRNASRRDVEPEVKRIRIRTVREEVVDTPRRTKPLPRKLATGKPKAGFGRSAAS